MELSKKQMQQVVDWINEKLPGGWKCGFCGERKGWKIDPTIFKRQEFDKEVFTFKGQIEIPLIVITCSNCGHQITIDSGVIGIKI